MKRREIPCDPNTMPQGIYDPWNEDESGRDDELLDMFDEVLDDREKFVLDGLLFEKLSLRELARRMSMSKTQVARMRDTALAKLRAELILRRGF